MLKNIIEILELIVIVLIGIAYLTLTERKILGIMQRRKGPNLIGPYGIIQPIVDGVKLVLKEIVLPNLSNKIYYMIGPMIILILCLIIWIPMPIRLGVFITDINYGLLFILAISSLNVYILLYSGWSSNSKYALIGSLRSIAQLISYEVSIGLILMSIIIFNNTLNLNKLIINQIYIPNIIALFPIFILFIISILAETNRPPFDLPESESELVAGWLIEYSGFSFAAIYLSEYGYIFFYSCLSSILFLGSVSLVNPITFFVLIFFIWMRASLPRLKYNELISLGWSKILPVSIAYLILTLSIVFL